MEIGVHHVRCCPAAICPPHHQTELDCLKDKAGGDWHSPCPLLPHDHSSSSPPPDWVKSACSSSFSFFFSFFFFPYLLVLIQLYCKNWILFFVLCLDYVRRFLIPTVVFLFLFFFFFPFFFRFRFKGNREKWSDHGSQNRAVEPRLEQFPTFLA